MSTRRRKRSPRHDDESSSPGHRAVSSDHTSTLTQEIEESSGFSFSFHLSSYRNKKPIAGRQNARDKKRIGLLLLCLKSIMFTIVMMIGLTFYFRPRKDCNNSKTSTKYSFYNTKNAYHFKPRVLFFHDDSTIFSTNGIQNDLVLDPMLRVNQGEETIEQPQWPLKIRSNSSCVPMQKWQSNIFPTCNTVHEFTVSLNRIGTVYNEEKVSIIGNGWFRLTWKIELEQMEETIVLKTLR